MSASPRPAPTIAGMDYVRPLGEGGFAQVYLYEQDMPRRMVAVKVLSSGLLDPQARADFEAEADAMARLSSHPSIVSVWGAGVALDGRPYLTMEFCPDSMRERTRGTPATPQVVLDAGVRLAGALESAHRAGVLHRDIKPSNVLIATTGRPALADFGISMLTGESRHAPGGSPWAAHGQAAGQGGASSDKAAALSIPWSSPEVISGEETGTVASEIWSLGATLYTFAAGRSPFEQADRTQNTQVKLSARIRRARYEPVPGAQGYAPLDAVLSRAMAPKPADRFASMLEFGEALQQVQRHWGFDVTPLDVIDAGWTAPAPRATNGQVSAPAPPRGPSVTSVREHTRAERRAAMRNESATVDRDGVADTTPPSRIVAGVIGAAIAVAALGGLVLLARVLGWIA